MELPLHFTLENNTQVQVAAAGAGQYEFTLSPTEGAARSFTYVDGEYTKAQWDERADYEQLEALRKFWLELEGED